MYLAHVQTKTYYQKPLMFFVKVNRIR